MDSDAKQALRALVGSDENFEVVRHSLPALTITVRLILDRWGIVSNQEMLSSCFMSNIISFR